MKKIIKKTISIILIIILIIIIGITSYAVIQQKILKKKYIDVFGYSIFWVATGSMSGTIEIDDVVLVKITKDIKENDIISFEQNDSIITHRVIKINQDQLVTKGDANNTEDEPILKEAVIGKVTKSFDKVGVWIKVFSDPKVLISIFTSLILFAVILSFNKENKSE